MSAPELHLHVGFQQTGAGMLRRALGRVRPQLHEHGIGLIVHGALAGAPSAAGWRCRGTVTPGDAELFEREVAGLVDRELVAIRVAGAEPRAIVVSSDHLLGRENIDGPDEQLLRPAAEASVAQMIRAVDATRSRVVMYLRRQDRLMEACYLRSLQQGGTRRFEQQFPRRFEPVLDYGGLIGRLLGLPQVMDVRVRPFELVGASAASYVEDLLAPLGLHGELDLAPIGDDLTAYRLYSPRAARIALEVNAHLGSPEERRLVRTFLLEHFAATDDAGTRCLGPDERQRILEAYTADNHRLFASHLPDLPVESYASDQATSRLVEVGMARTYASTDPADRQKARRARAWPASVTEWIWGSKARRRLQGGQQAGAERGRV
jgi:hypothetical protein